MTQKLYWNDAYIFNFEAEMVEQVDVTPTTIGIVLDSTHFYPEGGGQPSDKGLLNNAPIVEVKEIDGRIVHYVQLIDHSTKEFDVHRRVVCHIDTLYRKQNMRAHTGAHILFGAARRLFSKLEYAGFDIRSGGGSLYLRTDQPLTSDFMYRMLDNANNAMLEERSIKTYFVTPEEVARIPGCVYNVKLPEKNVRIVEIEEWDVAVCSGTHLKNSLEVGPISIVNREPHKKGITRLDYLVGKASIEQISSGERVLGDIGQILGSSRREVRNAIVRLKETATEEQKRSNHLEESLAMYRLQELIADANNYRTYSEFKLMIGVIRDVSQQVLRPWIVQKLKDRTKLVLIIVGHAEKSFVVAGRTDDVDLDIREIILPIVKHHNGGGGGVANLLFAGGMTSAVENILQDLYRVFETLLPNYNFPKTG